MIESLLKFLRISLILLYYSCISATYLLTIFTITSTSLHRLTGTTYSGRPGTGGSDVISSKSGSQTSGVRLPPIPGAQGPGPGPGQAVRQRTFNMGDL